MRNNAKLKKLLETHTIQLEAGDEGEIVATVTHEPTSYSYVTSVTSISALVQEVARTQKSIYNQLYPTVTA